jgi:hypothetical protein
MPPQLIPIPLPSIAQTVALNEFSRVIRSYSNVLVLNWPEPNREIGTAVFVRAAHRLFAVTAEHCVTENMALLITLGTNEQNRSSRILRHIKHDSLDVAVLELEQRSDVVACSIEQLRLDVPTPNRADPINEPLLWVAGYPSDPKFATLGIEHLAVTQTVFGSNLINSSATMLELFYHKDGHTIPFGGGSVSAATSDLPINPKGFSGAGIWRFIEVQEGEMFTPIQNVQLVGIQYSWLPQSRILKAVPASIVRDMIYTSYPDLQ